MNKPARPLIPFCRWKMKGLRQLLSIPSVFYVSLLICVLVLSQDTLSSWIKSSSSSRHDADQSSASNSNSSTTCLSRNHQHIYRRSKLAPSSALLLSSWKQYERMHRGCTEGKNWSLHLDSPGEISDCKYLFFLETNVGLGNRILSLITAAAYALITDRVLMVDTRKTLSSILCEPFNGSSWLLPDDFPFGVLDVGGPTLETAVAENFRGISFLRLMLDHSQTEGDKLFFCDEIQESLNEVKNLVWASNQYFVTGLFQVPVLWRKLVPLFSTENPQVFGHLSRLLLSPANDVWKIVTGFYQEQNIHSSRTVLGVQIRPHFRPNITAYDPFVSKLVQDCLQKILLLPRTFNRTAGSEEPATAAAAAAADYSVVVSSLQGKYFKFLRRLYDQQAVTTEDGMIVRVHSLSEEGFEQRSLRQDKLALAEIWLLSLSDHIVTSEFSTFGYVAYGIAGLRPLLLGIKESVGCFRSWSSQPCTHFPQTPKCGNFSASSFAQDHKDWLKNSVKHCQDHQIGSQLTP